MVQDMKSLSTAFSTNPALPPHPCPQDPCISTRLCPEPHHPCLGVLPSSLVLGQALLSDVTWLAACVSPALLLTKSPT